MFANILKEETAKLPKSKFVQKKTKEFQLPNWTVWAMTNQLT